MSAKKCLTSGDHAKIKNAVDKNKPMSMTKQKMAEKQEKMFYGLSKDSGFQKEISGLNKMDKITAIQNKYAQNGVKITRQKINKMMKNGVTIIKPLPIAIPKVIDGPIVIPKMPPKVVSIPKEIMPEIKPIAKAPPVGAFQEAKTMDEASKRWGEFGRNDIVFPSNWSDQKKIEVMNRVNAQMYDMKKWTKERKLGLLNFKDGKQDWVGSTGIDNPMIDNTLTLSTRNIFMKHGFGEKYFASLDIRRGSVCKSMGNEVLRHEMGHVLWYDSKLKSRILTSEFNEIFSSTKKSLIKNNISKYAATDVEEFFAETFTMYSSRQFKAGTLNKVFGGGFEELMEKILIGG